MLLSWLSMTRPTHSHSQHQEQQSIVCFYNCYSPRVHAETHTIIALEEQGQTPTSVFHFAVCCVFRVCEGGSWPGDTCCVLCRCRVAGRRLSDRSSLFVRIRNHQHRKSRRRNDLHPSSSVGRPLYKSTRVLSTNVFTNETCAR